MTRSKKKRDAPISYRPPERLRDEFHARVQNSGQSVNGYITDAIFGRTAPRSKRVSPLDQKMIAMLLSQAARINDRLEQAGRSSTDSGPSLILQECRDDLAEIRSYLMLALGRDP